MVGNPWIGWFICVELAVALGAGVGGDVPLSLCALAFSVAGVAFGRRA